VAWSYHTDAVQLAAQLQCTGTQLWVLERLPTSRSLFDIPIDGATAPVVLVGGNEVLGVDPGLLALADQAVHLPMQGRKESLNVAVALSVATYWLRACALATSAIQGR
jgi:tRNA G18 (ribose-2'-O)-methylase SpoU